MRRWLLVVIFLGACRGCWESPKYDIKCGGPFMPTPPPPPPPKRTDDLGVIILDAGPPMFPCVHDGKCFTIGDTCEVDTDADVIQCTCSQWTFGGLWSCDPPPNSDLSGVVDASETD